MPSKTQIVELEEMLIQKKEEILKNVNKSRSNIDEIKNQEVKDDLDYAELVSDSFTEGMIANHQLQELKQIEEAMKKVKDESYGKCEMCGINIPLGRLKAKPFAKFCTECREVYEKESLN